MRYLAFPLLALATLAAMQLPTTPPGGDNQSRGAGGITAALDPPAQTAPDAPALPANATPWQKAEYLERQGRYEDATRIYDQLAEDLKDEQPALADFAAKRAAYLRRGGRTTLDSAPKTLQVAAVQMRSTRDLDANVERTIQHLKKCAADGVQVAVFPECSVSGYFDDAIPKLTAEQLQAAERRLAAACREIGINAVVGMPVRDGDKLYNSAVVLSSEGKVVERYHKVQLAENWPTPGDHLSVFKLAGVPCSVIICHDERYPELVRLPVLAGARVVFYLSHESGLKQEAKLNPYRAQIQARAVENTVYIVHANAPANDDTTGSHGQSRVIAPDGNLLGEASMFREEVVAAKLDLTKATADNARRSLTRGPLQGWWKEGLKQVRIIE